MIAHLTGSVHKLTVGTLTIDVQGVGYLVTTPADTWDNLQDGDTTTLKIFTYVKEDRLDLFGFKDATGRHLFEALMKISGVGPALGLELCSVPQNILLQSINDEDASLLTNIKGVGKKKAEKLLVDLKSVVENNPALFAGSTATLENLKASFDQDAVAALTALGYDNASAMAALNAISTDLETTEERVKAALKVI